MSGMRGWAWHNWVALALLGAACAAASRELLRSAQALPAAAVAGAEGPAGPVPAPTLEARSEGDALGRLVLETVRRDPFHPARERAPGRYRTPAQAAAAAALAAQAAPPPEEFAPPPPPEPPVALKGLARDAGGRVLVVLEVNGATRVLRVGEEHGGFRLLSAQGGEVRLRGPNGVRTLRMGGP